MTESVEFPQSRCLAGVAEVDVTPPAGIYHRMWGAAKHDQSTGIHRPLLATVLALAPIDSSEPARDAVFFVGLDHCLLWKGEMDELLQRAALAANLREASIVVFFSHTHAAGLMGYERVHLPGGDLIPEYLSTLATRIGTAIRQALDHLTRAGIVYGAGDCSLATHRDYVPDAPPSPVCGFNPHGEADSTVVTGVVRSLETDEILLSVVNYACHPTTLAWDNTLISPDYVGAMREVIVNATGAPILFVQGASGDIGPREGFTGDVSVADRNGRVLGHAAASVIESLPHPLTRLLYTGAVESGATLGTWNWAPVNPQREREIDCWLAAQSSIPLALREDLPDPEALNEQLEQCKRDEQTAHEGQDLARALECRTQAERLTRALLRVQHLPRDGTFPFPLRMWRLGDAVWIALDGEHYNVLQRVLRQRFPGTPLIVGTLANGSQSWYLPDHDSYGRGLYQEAVSVLQCGSLEQLIDAITKKIQQLTDGP